MDGAVAETVRWQGFEEHTVFFFFFLSTWKGSEAQSHSDAPCSLKDRN